MSLHRIFYFSSSLAVAATVGAQIVVIDDFDSGTFAWGADGGVEDTLSQTGTTIIGGRRDMTITSSAVYFVSVDKEAPDGPRSVFAFFDTEDGPGATTPGAIVTLDYSEPFNLDLSSHPSAAFQVNITAVDLDPSSADLAMSFTIYDGLGGQSKSETIHFRGAANYYFPLSQFSASGGGQPVSVASINRITFKVEFPDRATHMNLFTAISIDSITAVPEPSHYAMIVGLGLMGFGWWRRRPIA